MIVPLVIADALLVVTSFTAGVAVLDHVRTLGLIELQEMRKYRTKIGLLQNVSRASCDALVDKFKG